MERGRLAQDLRAYSSLSILDRTLVQYSRFRSKENNLPQMVNDLTVLIMEGPVIVLIIISEPYSGL
jgi:hypothetical protein